MGAICDQDGSAKGPQARGQGLSSVQARAPIDAHSKFHLLWRGPSARSPAPVFARFLSDPGLRTCLWNRMSMMADDVDGRVHRQDLHRSISSAPPRRLAVCKGVYNSVTPLSIHRPPSPPSHAPLANMAITIPLGRHTTHRSPAARTSTRPLHHAPVN